MEVWIGNMVRFSLPIPFFSWTIIDRLLQTSQCPRSAKWCSECRGSSEATKQIKNVKKTSLFCAPVQQRSRVHVRVRRAVDVVFPYSIHIYFPSIPSSFVIRYLYIFFWRKRIFVSQHHLVRVRKGLHFRCEESERESAYGWWFGELFLPSSNERRRAIVVVKLFFLRSIPATWLRLKSTEKWVGSCNKCHKYVSNCAVGFVCCFLVWYQLLLALWQELTDHHHRVRSEDWPMVWTVEHVFAHGIERWKDVDLLASIEERQVKFYNVIFCIWLKSVSLSLVRLPEHYSHWRN